MIKRGLFGKTKIISDGSGDVCMHICYSEEDKSVMLGIRETTEIEKIMNPKTVDVSFQDVVNALQNVRDINPKKVKDVVQLVFTNPESITNVIMALEVLQDQLMLLDGSHPSLQTSQENGDENHDL